MPKAVYVEVVRHGITRGEDDARRVRDLWRRHSWPIVTVLPTQVGVLGLLSTLGHGEQEVLAFALTQRNPLVLMDDAIARNEARKLGLRSTGTLGIIVQAYRLHIITFSEVELLVEEIIQRPDIWISTKLCIELLANLRQESEDVG